MEILLILTFALIVILIAIGSYHNYYVLNTFNYERKKHEIYLNKITSILWKVIFIFICLWLIYLLKRN